MTRHSNKRSYNKSKLSNLRSRSRNSIRKKLNHNRYIKTRFSSYKKEPGYLKSSIPTRFLSLGTKTSGSNPIDKPISQLDNNCKLGDINKSYKLSPNVNENDIEKQKETKVPIHSSSIQTKKDLLKDDEMLELDINNKKNTNKLQEIDSNMMQNLQSKHDNDENYQISNKCGRSSYKGQKIRNHSAKKHKKRRKSSSNIYEIKKSTPQENKNEENVESKKHEINNKEDSNKDQNKSDNTTSESKYSKDKKRKNSKHKHRRSSSKYRSKQRRSFSKNKRSISELKSNYMQRISKKKRAKSSPRLRHSRSSTDNDNFENFSKSKKRRSSSRRKSRRSSKSKDLDTSFRKFKKRKSRLRRRSRKSSFDLDDKERLSSRLKKCGSSSSRMRKHRRRSRRKSRKSSINDLESSSSKLKKRSSSRKNSSLNIDDKERHLKKRKRRSSSRRKSKSQSLVESDMDRSSSKKEKDISGSIKTSTEEHESEKPSTVKKRKSSSTPKRRRSISRRRRSRKSFSELGDVKSSASCRSSSKKSSERSHKLFRKHKRRSRQKSKNSDELEESRKSNDNIDSKHKLCKKCKRVSKIIHKLKRAHRKFHTKSKKSNIDQISKKSKRRRRRRSKFKNNKDSNKKLNTGESTPQNSKTESNIDSKKSQGTSQISKCSSGKSTPSSTKSNKSSRLNIYKRPIDEEFGENSEKISRSKSPKQKTTDKDNDQNNQIKSKIKKHKKSKHRKIKSQSQDNDRRKLMKHLKHKRSKVFKQLRKYSSDESNSDQDDNLDKKSLNKQNKLKYGPFYKSSNGLVKQKLKSKYKKLRKFSHIKHKHKYNKNHKKIRKHRKSRKSSKKSLCSNNQTEDNIEEQTRSNSVNSNKSTFNTQNTQTNTQNKLYRIPGNYELPFVMPKPYVFNDLQNRGHRHNSRYSSYSNKSLSRMSRNLMMNDNASCTSNIEISNIDEMEPYEIPEVLEDEETCFNCNRYLDTNESACIIDKYDNFNKNQTFMLNIFLNKIQNKIKQTIIDLDSNNKSINLVLDTIKNINEMIDNYKSDIMINSSNTKINFVENLFQQFSDGFQKLTTILEKWVNIMKNSNENKFNFKRFLQEILFNIDTFKQKLIIPAPIKENLFNLSEVYLNETLSKDKLLNQLIYDVVRVINSIDSDFYNAPGFYINKILCEIDSIISSYKVDLLPNKIDGILNDALIELIQYIKNIKKSVISFQDINIAQLRNDINYLFDYINRFQNIRKCLLSDIDSYLNENKGMTKDDNLISGFIWILNMSERYYYDNSILLIHENKKTVETMINSLRLKFNIRKTNYLLNEWTNVIKLNESGFGEIITVNETFTDQNLIIKVILKSYDNDTMKKYELINDYLYDRKYLLQSRNSPFIKKFLGSFRIPKLDALFLVTEWCVCDISKFMKLTSEDLSDIDIGMEIWNLKPNLINDILTKKSRKINIDLKNIIIIYIFELFCILDYLTNINIVHTNIKLENILISHNLHLKLNDFGFEYNTRLITSSSDVVLLDYNDIDDTKSLLYKDPELLINNLKNNQELYEYILINSDNKFENVHYEKPNFLSDLWSVGIIAIQLLYSGYHIFNVQSKTLLESLKINSSKLPYEFLLFNILFSNNNYKRYLFNGLQTTCNAEMLNLIKFLISIFTIRNERTKLYKNTKKIYHNKEFKYIDYIDINKIQDIDVFKQMGIKNYNAFEYEINENLYQYMYENKPIQYNTFGDYINSIE